MKYDQYAIPTNFTNAGRILGVFEIRNFIEAVVLTVPIVFFLLTFLPLSFSGRLMSALSVSIPLGGFALIGVGGDSLTQWLICRWRWRKKKTLIFYRGEVFT